MVGRVSPGSRQSVAPLDRSATLVMTHRSCRRTGSRPFAARRLDAGRVEMPGMRSWVTLSARAQVAGECLRLVNAHIRIAHHGRQGVGNVALGDTHIPKVPGHTDNMDDTSIDMKWAQPRRYQRARFDFAARGPQGHPATVLDT